MIRLTLYSRQYCHLCHVMQEQVEALKPEFGLELVVLDVDADAELEARYNELVPVLMHGERELAHHRMEAQALRAYLAKIR